MDTDHYRLKRRAAIAAVTSLAVFVLCLAGIGLHRHLRAAALNPRVDVRTLAQRLGNAVGSERQQILNEAMPKRSDLLAAVVAGPNVTSSYGRTPILAWQRMRTGGELIVLGGRDGQVFFTVGGLDARIVATYPQRDSLLHQSLMGPSLLGAPDEEAPSESPLIPPPASGPAVTEVLPPAEFPAIAEGLLPSDRLRVLHPRMQQALRAALRERDWPALETEWLSVGLRNQQGDGTGHLLVLPRPKEATYAFAAYYLRPAVYAGAAISLLLYLFMLPWWVYLDARPRTEKALPLAIFVAITNFLGWLTYLVIRPEEQRQCPACATLLDPGFRLCPLCGWGAASRCRQCGRAARAEWHFCPYCETPRQPPPESEVSPAPI